MIKLETKLSLLRAVFECKGIPADQRREAFRKYSQLHAQRPESTVRRMEQELGLAEISIK